MLGSANVLPALSLAPHACFVATASGAQDLLLALCSWQGSGEPYGVNKLGWTVRETAPRLSITGSISGSPTFQITDSRMGPKQIQVQQLGSELRDREPAWLRESLGLSPSTPKPNRPNARGTPFLRTPISLLGSFFPLSPGSRRPRWGPTFQGRKASECRDPRGCLAPLSLPSTPGHGGGGRRAVPQGGQ